jgi:predicted MarR family transcription regulator
MVEKSRAPVGPIVSAAHLAEGAMPSLSELEFALTVSVNAFNRWIVRCMAAAGVTGLGPVEVLILHASNHRGREKTLSDICLMFNIEDTHIVTYAVKKLEAAGLIHTGRRGKEKTVKVTGSGEKACQHYHEVREALVVEAARSLGLQEAKVSELASLLRTLSGQYDQAARSAVSL